MLAAHLKVISLPSICGFLFRIAFWLLPSFVQKRLLHEPSKPEKLYPTSYLDGIRGLAALFVFFCHFSYTSFVITRGYGHGAEGENQNLLQLPIIRLFYSGPPMVCLFFVVSGYALSLKSLKQMRARNFSGLLNTMASSIFRRAARLFLPTAISTFMVVIMLRLGWYERTREFSGDRTFMRNIVEHHPARLPTFADQYYDWGWKLFDFVHIWSWEPFGGSISYDLHLWTIPVEFRASMVLFLVLIGVSRTRAWVRQVLYFTLFYYFLRWDRWDMMLFISGTMIAEFDLIRAESRSRSPSTSTDVAPNSTQSDMPPSYENQATLIFGHILAFVALYLLSQPDDSAEETPGWVTLASLIPEYFTIKYRFWQSIGGILFVFALSICPPLQRPFNHPAIQYLGKISYALYLMHGPVLHVVGYVVQEWAWHVTGWETQGQYIGGFLLSSVFIIPVVIWAGDVFWRGVDVYCVMFARWLESVCFIKG
ncbi:acyltransferase [Eremomyces bilateralis CBS 781.70]|uniref:Acyltransferase n=1 Tax=Eremomyces bilateralis CBS 781.70 TaxID=1392243 RepID=A0A6G1GFK6_9PEZI|nr:acyltransferase [Eremomyces bilateralis CBS 781.70]KAF1816701.1 acyltransferase [Eremomyces bilateralis CBS 781.70]